jgi:oxygen-independent coproporphyrinogen-3 oxidase
VVAERRALSAREALEEALFTGLRLTRGIDVNSVKTRYGVDVSDIYRRELEQFREAGVLIYDGRLLRLSRAGMLLANEIMAMFLAPRDLADSQSAKTGHSPVVD